MPLEPNRKYTTKEGWCTVNLSQDFSQELLYTDEWEIAKLHSINPNLSLEKWFEEIGSYKVISWITKDPNFHTAEWDVKTGKCLGGNCAVRNSLDYKGYFARYDIQVINPYIWVTWPTTVEEVDWVCKIFEENGFKMDWDHLPMVGILVSEKTFNWQPTENRRYPKFEDVPSLMSTTKGRVLSMIHYNWPNNTTLSNQVEKVFEELYNSNLCRAIQLNIVWPNIEEVTKIKKQFPEMKIVLQLSRKAMENLNNSEIAKKVNEYWRNIDYVLIDPSGWEWIEFDVLKSKELYWWLVHTCADVAIIFAWWLEWLNIMEKAWWIIESLWTKNVWFDTEARVRDKLSDKYWDDILNLEKVEYYVREIAEILKN